ncbi:uncharacterized protein PAC_13602 [Phialocephala subalpina]|uniref:Uncharacterized protein n=1 Tax=Phialocephala subalpina TaxID=576137 RepID=A0A1L7XF86_9HELO|nr:uncharacterized protein PAC_13602 [Phialocephala subalpina]
MADPLGTTASIIAIIQLSFDVVKYINGVGGATKDRKRLRDGVRACEFILQQLKDNADDTEEGKAWSETVKTLEDTDAPLGRLWVALNVVKAKLEPKIGLEKALTSLKWPSNEKEVEKIISVIEREKTLLQLALTNDCRKLIYEIKKCSGENKTQLTELIRVIEKSSSEYDGQFSRLIQTFETASTERKEQLIDVKVGIDGLHQAQHDQQRQAILDWLTPIDYAAQQSDFIARRQAGTGQWLLDSEEFQTWLNSDQQTLFCPGIPGAGKTMLTSIVVEELPTRFHDDKSIGIAYLYCNFRRQEEQKIDDLFASLLKQLAKGQQSLPGTVKELYDRYKTKRTRPSLDEISRSLQAVTTLYSRVFIIVDALDKCQVSDGYRQRFLSSLFNLQAKCGANLFATSRPISSIKKEFKGNLKLKIRASEKDVRKYLNGHLFRLPGFVAQRIKLQEEIKTDIVKAVNRMFLLAQLHLESLIGKRSPKAVQTALKNLATGSTAYNHAYKDAIERINGQIEDQKELTKQVLSWITCAKRPLATTELQYALGVKVGESKFDELNVLEIEDIVSICAGLVTIDEETVKGWSGHRKYSQEVPKKMTGLHLAAYFGVYEAANILIRRGQTPDTKDSNSRTPLSWAAENGREAVVKLLLDKGAELETKSSPWRQTPLSLAAQNGHEAIVQLLLDKGAELQTKSFNSQTPLSWAAQSGHEAVVKLLLDKGAELEIKDSSWSQTPLSLAAENGHEAVVKLLLDKGAELETKSFDSQTPLSLAAENGHEAIVQLLLDKGAKLETKDSDNRTPLSWAT